jgi:tRNA(Ile)-lysidine synthase
MGGGFLAGVETTVLKYDMLKAGKGAVVGLSGGADSVALLTALLDLREKYAWTLTAVHVHHCLRPVEADLDQEFAAEFCAARGVPFRAFRADARAFAAERGLSIEEAGREKRYEAFERVRAEVGADKIAVGHNMDDQAETVLMRVMRGAGGLGLAAVPPVRGRVIRPLLFAPRREIEAFLTERGIKWRTDATNAETIYVRNRARGELLPALRAFNPNISAALARTAAIAATENDFLDKLSRAALDGCRENIGELSAPAFNALEPALKPRVIRLALAEAGFTLKDVAYANIRDAVDLAGKPSGKRLCLPGGAGLRVSFDRILIERRDGGAPRDYSYELRAPGAGAGDCCAVYVKEAGVEVTASAEELESFGGLRRIFSEPVGVDGGGRLIIRNRRPGDRFRAGNGTKSLKKLMIAHKIDARERAAAPLLCDDSGVLWVIGRFPPARRVPAGAVVRIAVWEGRYERDSQNVDR